MTLIGGSRRQVRVNRVGFALSRFTPDSRPSSEGSASPKRAKLQTYNLADDAAGESKRIVLGSRWLGGTLQAEAGRSCTVRRRLKGARGGITTASVTMSPRPGSLYLNARLSAATWSP